MQVQAKRRVPVDVEHCERRPEHRCKMPRRPCRGPLTEGTQSGAAEAPDARVQMGSPLAAARAVEDGIAQRRVMRDFLLFDNGCYNPTGKRSRILEINPRIGASGAEEVAAGKYIDPVVAGYKTNPANLVYHQSKQLVWSYQSSLQNSFYSSYISSVMRLPNGNTSICSGATGHLFEVTPTGEVVWEYLVPGVAGPNVKYVESDSNNAWQVDDNQYRGLAYFTFRHFRYGSDFPGFTGKNLTPKGTLTGLVPRLVGEGRTKPASVTYTGFGFGATGVTAGSGGGVGAGSGGGTGY